MFQYLFFNINGITKYMKLLLLIVTFFIIIIAPVSYSDAQEDKARFYINEYLGGGETSRSDTTSNAFSSHVNNLKDVVRIRRFNIGDDFFENPWVGKTASTELRDGLGPLFNNNACQDCHIRDGRGHAPADSGQPKENDFSTMIIKAINTQVSSDDKNRMLAGTLGGVGDSQVGPQLQQEALFSIKKEASLSVTYQYHSVYFTDGTAVELRTPYWTIKNNYADSTQKKKAANDSGFDVGFGSDFDTNFDTGFDAATLFSPRIASPMIGLGLLALIDEKTILQRSDPEDKDNDNISGKANKVWSVSEQKPVLGRFGWKAGQPSIRQQTAGAFNNDMGLTSNIFPHEGCLEHQHDCLKSPNGNGDSRSDYPFEVSVKTLDFVEFYASHLSVPARRNSENIDVKAGKQLFIDAQCQACHTERYTTVNNPSFPELSQQAIYPYTDLLLHDMGEKLADINIYNDAGSTDALVEYQATATEWRTPPLWGLGLTKTVNPNATFLHDGRARTIMEAVLWHGGEAQASVDKVLAFDREQREQLMLFLNDL